MVNQQQLSRLDKLLIKCRQLVARNNDQQLLTLSSMISLENYKFGFKLVHGLLPTEVSECAMTDHTGKSLVKKHKYNTQKKLIPNQPIVQCTKYNNSVFCKGHREYANLSTELRSIKILLAFINKCKLRLLTMKS